MYARKLNYENVYGIFKETELGGKKYLAGVE